VNGRTSLAGSEVILSFVNTVHLSKVIDYNDKVKLKYFSRTDSTQLILYSSRQ
jgi:hypothetical protein